jgi:hypothetical protein
MAQEYFDGGSKNPKDRLEHASHFEVWVRNNTLWNSTLWNKTSLKGWEINFTSYGETCKYGYTEI